MYAAAFLFVMVPHAIITVSLATAILPRLSAKAADGDLPGLAGTLAGTLRTALAVVIPFAFALPLLAYDASKVLFGYGATATTFDHYVPSMILFGPGIVFFTVHYLMLRGFYALELNRTGLLHPVRDRATNVVVAILLVHAGDRRPDVAGPGDRLRRVVPAGLDGLLRDAPRARLGGLETPSPGAVPGPAPHRRGGLDRRRLGRRQGAARPAGDDVSHALAAVRVVVLGGLDLGLFVVLARLMRHPRGRRRVLDTVDAPDSPGARAS